MGARILVVEDNQANLDLMLYLLKAFGHQPEGVADGLRAIDAARERDYDLVLSDVLMPNIDGFELARRFKADEVLKDRKLVAVTALAMVGDRERLLAAGFDGYIAKPIDPQLFVKQVESYLSGDLHSTVTHDRPQQSDPAPVPSDPTGPTILVVDDVEVNLEVIRGALQPFGYRIVTARSVREASAKIAEMKPALVLCDVHMPDGNGYELIAKMKSVPELRRIPFLFLSSTAWHTWEKAYGIALGAVRFLLRPIDPQRLLAEVQVALEGVRDGEDSDR